MKKHLKNKAVLLKVVGLISLFALSGCGDQNNKSNKKTDKSSMLVKAMTLGKESDLTKRVYPGHVVANKKVDLAFQVPGQINQLPIVEGQSVHKDSILAALDSRDYQSRFNAAKAKLVKAKQDHERANVLVKKGTIPESVFDEALEKYNVASSDKNQAEKALKDTKLIAPFSGVVAKVYVENFENIHAKELILSLQDISHIDIELSIPEQDIIQLKPTRDEKIHGKQIEGDVTFNGIPNKRFKADVKEYSTQADKISQTYKITLTMPAPEDINILPGMNANIHVILPDRNQEKGKGFLVPTSAILTGSDGKHYVWLVDQKAMRVKKEIITIENLNENQVYMKGNLKKGDQIITAGVSQLSENEKITIIKKKEK